MKKKHKKNISREWYDNMMYELSKDEMTKSYDSRIQYLCNKLSIQVYDTCKKLIPINYVGKLSEDTAEKHLENKISGSFIIRFSTENDELFITLNNNSKIVHIPIDIKLIDNLNNINSIDTILSDKNIEHVQLTPDFDRSWTKPKEEYRTDNGLFSK